MADLATTYLGLRLTSPIVASPSPLTGTLKSLLELEAAGVGAVVLPSLFEEQLAQDDEILRRGDMTNVVGRRVIGLDLDEYNSGSAAYLRLVQQARRQLGIPVIASLNCSRPNAWPEYARMLEVVGASAVELNIDPMTSDPSRSSADVEDGLVGLVASITDAVEIPVAVKLSPFITAPVHLANRLEEAGAGGLVLFPRLHEPDIDLQRSVSVSRLTRSSPEELGLRLRWLAILRDRVHFSLAATGGVWGGEDAAKAVFAGADVVMVASLLLERGVGALAPLLNSLEAILDGSELASIATARGLLALKPEGVGSKTDRAAYLSALLGAAASVKRQ